MSRAIEITDLDDERLADYRDLRDADLRGARSLFTVESVRVVQRFIRSGWPIESLLLEPHAVADLRDDLATIQGDTPIYLAAAGALRTISGYGFHGGALALGRRDHEREGLTSLKHVLSKPQATILAAEGVVHVDNMGGLFRNGACLGASGILLSPTCADPLLRKTVRISMGRVFTIPWASCPSWLDALEELRSAYGFHLVALETGAGSCLLEKLELRPKTIMLVGAEGAGIHADTLRMCDQILEIPSLDPEGGASVNVAVASGIGLYELGRRRRDEDLR